MKRKHSCARRALALSIAALAATLSPCFAPGDGGFAAVAAGAEETGLPEEPAGALTLAHALALGLARSPDLSAHTWEIRAREARALQAAARPNPELAVELEDVAGGGDYSGTRSAQTTVRLSQLIELGGKRRARREVASALQAAASRDYEIARVDVLTDVAEKFVLVLSRQHEVALTREAAELAETALQAARRRAKAGKASAVETNKAAIALARNTIAREHAEHELLVARKKLAATWAGSEPRFTRAEGDIFEIRPVTAYGVLAARLQESPEIARWASEKKLREAEIALAVAKRTPNLSIGAGVRRLEDPDTEVLVAEISVPLPIFDRNQGGTAEAEALAHQTESEHRRHALRLETLLFGLYQELLHAWTAIDSLQGVVLPQARETLVLAQRGFDEGRYSYLELLDAQRTFVEVRTEAIETATAYHRYLLGIERLIGEPLEGAPALQVRP